MLSDGIDFSGLGSVGDLFDIDQVEVLRGPQGTLHGANALAGLINIRTGEPQAEPGLEVQASGADYNTWSAGIVGTGPLVSDSLLYRLALSTYRSDGFMDNDYLGRDDTDDRDETSARGKLRWLAGPRDTLDLTAISRSRRSRSPCQRRPRAAVSRRSCPGSSERVLRVLSSEKAS